MSICSSNLQDHGGNTNSSWLESDLKVRKCHAILFFESLYEPKTDRLDHRCRRKFHAKGGKLKTFHRRYVRVLKGGVPVPFPSPFFFEIPLPSAQIPFPLAEFGKNPSVIHTTSFRFASAKLRLLNTTQQRPKNSQGFTKMF